MRFLLTGLAAICVLAGLHVRVLAATTGCHETCGTCCEPGASHEKSCGDDGCPSEHHHHHGACCSQALPLAAEDAVDTPPAMAGDVSERARPEAEIAPEEPFLGSEKPPLI